MHKKKRLMLCLLCLPSTYIFLIISESSDLFRISTSTIFDLYHPLTKRHHTGREDGCDLSKGRWVRDWSRPRYTRKSCSLIHKSFNCEKFGKDMDYANWRWKPDSCELQGFDPERFLSIVRGKRMAFIGDSIGQNQYSSLLCLLSQVASPVDLMEDLIYDRWEAFHFPSHNFTLSTIKSPFLVKAWSDIGLTEHGFVVVVDEPEFLWTAKLRDLHYAVISCGPWFMKNNYYVDNDENIVGCTLCRDGNRKRNATSLSLSYAVQKALTTALQYIRDCEECEENGLLTILRLASPSHFENGGWDSGGRCNRTLPFSEGDVRSLLHGGNISFHENLEVRRAQMKVWKRLVGSMGSGGSRKKMRFVDMDVTRAMLMRPDAHPGSYYNNDCLHWCLPGPADFWNNVLLNILESQR